MVAQSETFGSNETFWAVLQTGSVVPLAIGEPGTAKTSQIRRFGEAVGREVFVVLASIREPTDFGVPFLVKSQRNGRSVRLAPPEFLSEIWRLHDQGRESVVFADEITTCSPAQQVPLLGMMAEKRVGDDYLPPTTWIAAACNPPGQAANGFELESPMSNRLYLHPWQMDADAWDRGLLSGLEFPVPSFKLLPADWRSGLSLNGSRFAAFRRRRPSLLSQYPSEDRAKAGAAWPSPRSWTNACICATAVGAVTDDPAARYQAIAGCVGDEAAHEFRIWEQELDLPDPEELIQKATDAQKAGRSLDEIPIPDRSDKVLAMIGALSDRILNHGNTRARWEAAMGVVGEVWKSWREVAIIGGASLSKGYRPGYEMPVQFHAEAIPLMVQAGILKGEAA